MKEIEVVDSLNFMHCGGGKLRDGKGNRFNEC